MTMQETTGESGSDAAISQRGDPRRSDKAKERAPCCNAKAGDALPPKRGWHGGSYLGGAHCGPRSDLSHGGWSH